MPSPPPGSPLVPTFEVLVDGSPLPVAAEMRVVALTVDEDPGLPTMFAVQLVGTDDQAQPLPWVDDQALFAVGNAVEVRLGYDRALETLIVGEITGLEPEFARDGLPVLTVRGFDRLHRLVRGRRTRTFAQQKDSDVAAQLAREGGLDANVDDSAVVHEYLVQAGQTDLEFLEQRAARIQFEVAVEDRTLLFRPAQISSGAAASLSFDDDLLEFRPRLSSMGQATEVTVRGWSVAAKQEIVGRAGPGDEVSTMGGQRSGPALAQGAFGAAAEPIGRWPVLTQPEADQLARARFNAVALGLITGDGLCRGRTDVRRGRVVRIDGLGTRFSGEYYVTATAHRYTARRGYETSFTVRRNAS